MVKNLLANAGDVRDAGRSLGREDPQERGMSNPLQYSCLENPMDRGDWQAVIHDVAEELDKT